jgi:hypothetical protein
MILFYNKMEKAKNTYHTVVGTIPKSNIKICIINDTFDNKMKKPKNITLSGPFQNLIIK